MRVRERERGRERENARRTSHKGKEMYDRASHHPLFPVFAISLSSLSFCLSSSILSSLSFIYHALPLSLSLPPPLSLSLSFLSPCFRLEVGRLSLVFV